MRDPPSFTEHVMPILYEERDTTDEDYLLDYLVHETLDHELELEIDE